MNTKKTYEIIDINPGSCGLGDMLFIGVGGTCWIAEPPPCPDRDHILLHYKHPKCRYYLFDDMEKIARDLR